MNSKFNAQSGIKTHSSLTSVFRKSYENRTNKERKGEKKREREEQRNGSFARTPTKIYIKRFISFSDVIKRFKNKIKIK